MNIEFATIDLRDLCNTYKLLISSYGEKIAKQTGKRLYDLAAASVLYDMRNLPGRCEELKGDRKGQLSVRLGRQFRLVFEPTDDPIPRKPDGGLDWNGVKSIKILEIRDYHD